MQARPHPKKIGDGGGGDGEVASSSHLPPAIGGQMQQGGLVPSLGSSPAGPVADMRRSMNTVRISLLLLAICAYQSAGSSSYLTKLLGLGLFVW